MAFALFVAGELVVAEPWRAPCIASAIAIAAIAVSSTYTGGGRAQYRGRFTLFQPLKGGVRFVVLQIIGCLPQMVPKACQSKAKQKQKQSKIWRDPPPPSSKFAFCFVLLLHTADPLARDAGHPGARELAIFCDRHLNMLWRSLSSF